MKVRMVPHAKAPNRKNHVNVYGHWRILAEACRFPYTKIIMFKYMSNGTDLDVKEVVAGNIHQRIDGFRFITL
nr:hypothetical protein [Tanacetum cinerariifolium]